jgi:hypothetical protein
LWACQRQAEIVAHLRLVGGVSAMSILGQVGHLRLFCKDGKMDVKALVTRCACHRRASGAAFSLQKSVELIVSPPDRVVKEARTHNAT